MSFGGALSSTLAWSLVFAGVPLHAGAPQCTGADDRWGVVGASLQEFDELMAELDEALVEAEDGRSSAPGARARIEAALTQLRFRPVEVAERPHAEADIKIKRAMAVLAAAELGADPSAAAAWLDAALARPGPALVDVEGLGPELAKLRDHRRNILAVAGTARLGVICDVPCKVIVDGHMLGGGGEYALAPGAHDVWVFARSPEGTHADFGIVEVTGSRDGTCMFFPRSGGLALLTGPEQWWAAVNYARRLAWAMDCQDLPDGGFDSTTLTALLAEAPVHTSVLARNEALRVLRIDAAFTLARASGDDGPIDAALRGAALDVLPLDSKAAEFGSELEARYHARRDRILDGPRGIVDLRCHDRCVATIDQVFVEPGRHRVPVGSHDVRLYDAAGVATPVDAAIVVERDGEQLVSFGEPPAPPPPPRLDPDDDLPKDPETFRRMPPRTRAMVFGLGGGLSLFGGAAWGLAIAAGGLSRTNQALALDPDSVDPNTNPVNVGLIAGAVGFHAAIAVAMFVLAAPLDKRRARSTKPNKRSRGGAAALSGRF